MAFTIDQLAPLVAAVGQFDSDLAPYTNTIGNILMDPFLSETVDLIGQISDTYPPRTPLDPPGVGLASLVPPLKAVLYGREHWWFWPLAGLTALAIPVLVGYGIGRRAA